MLQHFLDYYIFIYILKWINEWNSPCFHICRNHIFWYRIGTKFMVSEKAWRLTIHYGFPHLAFMVSTRSRTQMALFMLQNYFETSFEKIGFPNTLGKGSSWIYNICLLWSLKTILNLHWLSQSSGMWGLILIMVFLNILFNQHVTSFWIWTNFLTVFSNITFSVNIFYHFVYKSLSELMFLLRRSVSATLMERLHTHIILFCGPQWKMIWM